MTVAVSIRPFQQSDEEPVIALWHACGLTRPWNDPRKDIARKLAEQPELFLVAVADAGVDAGADAGAGAGAVVGSAMVGYDGHRGWVNYLAVDPGRQRLSIGAGLMREAERLLLQRGCPKLNLQVRSTNTEVLAFYARLGYAQDDVVSLGKRLISDEAG